MGATASGRPEGTVLGDACVRPRMVREGFLTDTRTLGAVENFRAS
ncbi:hypothetical protein OG689_02565 [Kitasatospora sp. NBC_00240]|nr:hypothetical protein [Kitasatospora sp. NBC_00240]MCX5208199.1 hypothetical protein [Kitasatospora sp. NBC_00240]